LLSSFAGGAGGAGGGDGVFRISFCCNGDRRTGFTTFSVFSDLNTISGDFSKATLKTLSTGDVGFSNLNP
jgi:hypothetical protein